MGKIVIRDGRKGDSRKFLSLLLALAKFEKLEPPSRAARSRIIRDIFDSKRIHLFVASDEDRLVGYALYLYTYSSFLAKPTLYLEDLYVLEEYRSRGVGFSLFRKCVDKAVARGCGRMEWSVLTWNEKALKFYEKVGARRLSDWYVYRLEGASLLGVPPAMTK